MKISKLLSAALALCLALLCLPAAGEGEITIREIMDANTLAEILKKHDSAAIHQTGGRRESAVYVDKELRYSAQRTNRTASAGDTEVLAVSDMGLLYLYQRGAGGVMRIPVLLLDIGLNEDGPGYRPMEKTVDFLYDAEATAMEKVLSVSEKDGRLVVETRLDHEDYARFVSDAAEGSWNRVRYTLDKDTLEMISQDETVMSADDREISSSGQAVYYDAPRPEEAGQMLDMLNYILGSDDKRTVTYILRPGTARERTVSVSCGRGCYVMIDGGAHDYELYLDRDMTKPAGQDDLMTDQTYYVRLSGEDEVAV